MRKLLLTLALGCSLTGLAQVFNVGQIVKLDTPVDPAAKVVAISPQADYILLSNDQNVGLTKFDLATKQTHRLTDAKGAGYNVLISPDGQDIVYRETSFNERHLRYNALKSMSVADGSARQLVEPTRDLQGYAIQEATAAAVDNGHVKVKAVRGNANAAQARPVLSINNRQLMITRNGRTEVFSPKGTDYSYIWESISPDGTKALFYVCGVGAFVCNLDGSNLIGLGEIRAPKWYDNSTIVGMYDQDNGYYVTSSVIKAATLDGKVQTLTDGSVIAMEPVAAEGVIAFSTPMGETYLINVSK
jgi:Tol biopolymer transport system component